MEKWAIVIVPMIMRKPFAIYAKISVGLYQKRKGRMNTLNKPEMNGMRFSSCAVGAWIRVWRSHPPKARKKRHMMRVFLRYVFLVILTSLIYQDKLDQET
jgi:hypothetical protein